MIRLLSNIKFYCQLIMEFTTDGNKISDIDLSRLYRIRDELIKICYNYKIDINKVLPE